MSRTMLTGPLLGVEADDRYTVCFLTEPHVRGADVVSAGATTAAKHVGTVPSGRFWRAVLAVPAEPEGRHITYAIRLDGESATDLHDRAEWTFHVPGVNDAPQVAYASCNGFSSFELMGRTKVPYALWERMAAVHLESGSPYSLLIMGGDQLYGDDIWIRVPTLERWSSLDYEDQIKRSATKEMKEQIDRFYDYIYRTRWADEHMSLMLASIPSVMMWDDHDIFDGWGSYPDELQRCAVYQAIFATARQYFELFQIRSRHNTSLFDNQAPHYAFGFTFRRYRILGLDNRAERTRSQIMGPDQWRDVIDFLDDVSVDADLLVMSAVPVIYRDFSLTETVFDATPWEEELTDDLKDHWRAREHQGERARLIMRLLANAAARWAAHRRSRTVILSGDVHIGCVGVVNDRRGEHLEQVHQVVSSGVVHPTPSRIQWLGIMAVTNDDVEYLNEAGTIETRLVSPFGSSKYIRTRNYLSLKVGTDDKLWVTWECESDDKPEYPIS